MLFPTDETKETEKMVCRMKSFQIEDSDWQQQRIEKNQISILFIN